MRLFGFVACLFLVAACSNGSAEGEQPPPGPTEATEPTTPTTLGAASVVSIAPEDGWVNVAPLANVVVRYDRAIDPASIVEADVSLADEFGPRAVDVTLDGTDMLVVDPVVRIPKSRTVEVSIRGLVTTNGDPVDAVQLSFEIHGNQDASLQLYWDGVADRGSREVTDEDGQVIGRVTLRDPGPDGTWLTDDDVEALFIGPRSLQDGRVVTVTATSRGDDALWGTLDDVVGSYRFSEATPEGLDETRVDAPGPDGDWFTSDDRPARKELYNRTVADGAEVMTWLVSTGPGADETWYTPDDRDFDGHLVARGSEGEWLATAPDAPGPDATWFTEDDVYASFQYEVEDPQGGRLVLRSTAPGPDAIWGTDDDEVAAATRTVYDDRHVIMLEVGIADPGEDGIWGTQDDDATSATQHDLDDDGLPSESRWIRNFFTERTTVYRYTPGGLLEEVEQLGPSGEWLSTVHYDVRKPGPPTVP